ncbi:replication initiation factor domain-containing protein, partial [Rubellimicrobium roseum]
MAFDYYAATLPASVTHAEAMLLHAFPGDLDTAKPVRPFTAGKQHREQGFRLYHGGVNPHPFFVASGKETPKAVEFVRRVYPAHRVSRADVAIDTVDEGAFDHLVALIDPIARKAGVKVTMVGDPNDEKRTTGRTMYFGAWSSDVRLYVYEKDKEQEARGLAFHPGHVRLELRAKPRKERKSLAATMDEDQLWGLSTWTREVLEKLDGTIVPFVPDQSKRKSTVERAFDHMLD